MIAYLWVLYRLNVPITGIILSVTIFRVYWAKFSDPFGKMLRPLWHFGKKQICCRRSSKILIIAQWIRVR